MKYLSVCSGIEAASVAFQPYGWKPVAFSEIDKFPSNLLRHRYPETPNWGDMSLFKEWPDADVDVLCGGTPCQSFSVAGLRQGLADPRGNLMLTFGAIARRYGPRWVVWENVPGVLSSNGGRDFAAFLGLLGQLGYGWAYRVLDAQYVRTRRFPFAVPQRRRRVFVVGYFGDWRRAAAVLFDRESLSGHPPPRREAGQGAAPTLAARTRGGGGLGTDFDCDGGLIASKSGEVGYCLTASAQQSLDAEKKTLIAVAHALRAEGFDASEDGTGRGTPLVPVAIQERAVSENPENGPQGAGFRQDGAAYTLEARNKVQAVAFDCKGAEVQYTTDGAHPTLRSMGHNNSHQNVGGHAALALPRDNGESHAGTQEADPGALLRALRDAVGAQAFAEWGSGILDPLQSPEVLRSWLHGERVRREASKAGPELDDSALARAQGVPAGAMQRLWQDGPDGRSPQGRELAKQLARELGTALPILPPQGAPWAVRRLTPKEAERLQGFPDGYTDVPYRGRAVTPDGHRYKALGNSWAINCVDWIAERMTIVDGWHDAR